MAYLYCTQQSGRKPDGYHVLTVLGNSRQHMPIHAKTTSWLMQVSGIAKAYVPKYPSRCCSVSIFCNSYFPSVSPADR